jgi:ankyrin repeat protein
VVKQLISFGADVNVKDKERNTALIIAAKLGHVAVVKTLLAHCADVRATDNQGKTASKWAVEKQQTKIFQLLVSAPPCN